MPQVQGVITNIAKAYWSSPSPTSPTPLCFAIGRGGWIDPGSGPVARLPDPTLEDLDIIQNPSRYSSITSSPASGNNIYFVQKDFDLATDYSNITTSADLPHTLMQLRCILDFTDFNDIQGVASNPPGTVVLGIAGVNPQLWELGVFVAAPSGYTNPTSVTYSGRGNLLMIFYATFNAETKNSQLQLENDVTILYP